MRLQAIVLIVISFGSGCSGGGDPRPLRVATAASFAAAAQEIAAAYEAETGQEVDIVVGATGSLFAQITSGAPYDIFLSADTLRPALLDSLNLTIPGSRITYARGSLVLWSRERGNLTADALESAPGKRLAMANPRLAPYGQAAQDVLNRLGIADAWRDRVVVGESVGQAFQFARTSGVAFGFVAESQAKSVAGGFWRIPDSLYNPILQQGVALSDHPAVTEFMARFRSPETARLLRGSGFRTAEDG